MYFKAIFCSGLSNVLTVFELQAMRKRAIEITLCKHRIDNDFEHGSDQGFIRPFLCPECGRISGFVCRISGKEKLF